MCGVKSMSTCTIPHEGSSSPTKKEFHTESLLNMASLREYFQCEYIEGGLFNHDDFEFLEEEWVWHYRKIPGLKVWADAWDLCTAKPVQVRMISCCGWMLDLSG